MASRVGLVIGKVATLPQAKTTPQINPAPPKSNPGHDGRLRLKTIPGVGPRTAEALVSAIDDPHRFKNGRQVSAYLGLVPKQYQSGETDRNGRISKRGPSLVRSILVECVWVSLRYYDQAIAKGSIGPISDARTASIGFSNC